MSGKGGAVWIARQCQEILVTAISTSDTGKPIAKDTTIKVPVDHPSYIGPEEAVLPGKTFIIDLLQRFKMIFDTLIIL